MNSNKEAYVIGAGGHAKVVIVTLKEAGYTVKAAFDDDSQKWGKDLLGIPVVGPPSQLESLSDPQAVIALGENTLRKTFAGRFRHVKWLTAVHRTAYVHPTVELGPGTVVFAGAVVQPDARIGSHCIINTCATIDHDCVLKDFVHIAPGVNLAGGVLLEEGVFIGIGSAIIPQASVGGWTVVGAGGVVDGDLAAQLLAVGVPARPIRKRE
ncbi:MAG: transferase [Acidobacteria bacterium]|nr:MAG: transferase [Acidobacteriota bacterium]